MPNEERRSFPRMEDKELTLKLNLGDFDAMTHTLNISASGLYCKVEKEVPLMSRVRLMLMMPSAAKDEKSPSQHLALDGVVVRTHPVIIDGVTKHYDVAIFFDNLSQNSREAIMSYIAKKRKS